MNINLIYEGKNYNFDIPNDVTIDYLKELSSKIFNSEKELLDLMYNNKKITNNGDNILIRDLIPEGESNAILTVQINKNLNNNKKKKEKKIPFEHLKLRNNIENINTEKNNNDTHDNDKEKKMNKIQQKMEDNQSSKNEKLVLDNIYNNNIQSKIKLMFINNNKLNYKGMNIKEKFNNAYIQKNGELLSLIRQFGDKIKKIYLILYNKYNISKKNLSSNTTLSNIKTTRNESINYNLIDNSFYELALYEKKIMNYLEIQIQHYKILLETIKNYDNNINFDKLTDFYHKLYMFIPEENYINKEKRIKIPFKRNKKLNSNNSAINLTSFSSNNNKLPALKINNYKSPILKEAKKEKLLSEIKMSSNAKINNINEINNKKKELKESKIQKNNNINKKINIEEEEDNISSNSNTNKNNNILDNISEKNSIESDSELKDNLNNISNVTPIRLKKKVTNKINSEKNEIENNIIPMKENKIVQRKDSVISNINKFKNSLEKKITLDLDMNQNKKEKKVKDINTSSMTVKDSNFTLEKNYFFKDKKNSINKYDYVM